MKEPQVSLLYFSASGVTRKCLQKIAEGIGSEANDYDLTSFQARRQKYEFTNEDLVLIGMPVFRGRIPTIADEFFAAVTANGTPAVFVVSYGNVYYDNALLELKDRSEEKGFVGIAAAAVIGEHSSSNLIATGRPDRQDQIKLLDFGRQIRTKLNMPVEWQELQVKGERPYGQDIVNRTTPATNDNCDDCGICAEVCPTLAINPDDVKQVEVNKCIGCRRCIHLCPQRAKYVDDPHSQKFIASLIERAAARKEPDFFI